MRLLHYISLIFIFSIFLSANNDTDLSIENNSTKEKDDESFLSLLEYGKMLYNNPRGIPCSKCHGKAGEGGKKIAKYYDKHQNIKLLRSSNIRNFSLEELTASLKNQYRKNGKRKRHKIMPMYYMTKQEILAIFTYLKSNRDR
ncbi:Putative periplasmic protein [hydrothermal vent metagenome]|uniref:Putative periplasmic protein n=1 Tax=hydrothermal vent metagenome TaxID=652676 RepID=A0A1W1CMK3_9ZZZZ